MLSKPLYFISDATSLTNSERQLDTLASSLDVAAPKVFAVQYREMSVFDRENQHIEKYLQSGVAIKELCEQHHVKFIVNRSLELAKAVSADGIHLGADCSDIQSARESFGVESSTIGYSAHSVKEALSIVSKNPDYLFLSPIFPPLSKPDARDAIGCEPLHQLSRQTTVPVFGLGGISSREFKRVLQSGASGAAMITTAFSRDSSKELSRCLAIIDELEGQNH